MTPTQRMHVEGSSIDHPSMNLANILMLSHKRDHIAQQNPNKHLSDFFQERFPVEYVWCDRSLEGK